MKYISVNLFRKMIDHALEEGMSREDFAHLPVSLEMLDDIQAVPADTFFELHEMLDKALPGGYAVRVGQQMKMDDYGVLGLSWKTCSTAGEIFERSERYFKLLSNTYVFNVEKDDETARVHLLRDGYRRGVALSNEATFSATVVVLKAMTETDISPVRVSFKHGPPPDISTHKEAFGCPVLFDQASNTITYRRTDFDTRTAKADASINAFLVERVEEETQGIEISPGKIALDVERLIKDALPSGIPSIHHLGAHMGMSSRTLTRRLAEHDLGFRDLVNKVQLELSRDLLADASKSLGEIAFQTGFSEQSAFNRAFKRWTGQTPAEFRKSSF